MVDPEAQPPPDLVEPGLEALASSINRFNEARDAADASQGSVVVPCLEALWWARALDEFFEQPPNGGYEVRRASDPVGRICNGVRWARNRGGHSFHSVLAYSPGATWPMRWPMRFGDFNWVSMDEMRVMPNSRRDRTAEEVYAKHMAGRPVIHALTDVLDWLQREAATRGPEDPRAQP